MATYFKRKIIYSKRNEKMKKSAYRLPGGRIDDIVPFLKKSSPKKTTLVYRSLQEISSDVDNIQQKT